MNATKLNLKYFLIITWLLNFYFFNSNCMNLLFIHLYFYYYYQYLFLFPFLILEYHLSSCNYFLFHFLLILNYLEFWNSQKSSIFFIQHPKNYLLAQESIIHWCLYFIVLYPNIHYFFLCLLIFSKTDPNLLYFVLIYFQNPLIFAKRH